jgi:hypothetical protein
MRYFFFLLITVALGFLAGITFHEDRHHRLELFFEGDAQADLVLYFDTGSGFNEQEQRVVAGPPAGVKRRVVFQIPWQETYPPLKLLVRGEAQTFRLSGISFIQSNLFFQRREEFPVAFPLAGFTGSSHEAGVWEFTAEPPAFLLLSPQDTALLLEEKWRGPVQAGLAGILLSLLLSWWAWVTLGQLNRFFNVTPESHHE